MLKQILQLNRIGADDPELAVFELSRDHRVRFSDSAAFVTGFFQAFVGNLRSKRFQRGVVALSVCLSASFAVHGIGFGSVSPWVRQTNTSRGAIVPSLP
jgi:hypothetical protein